jgi:hypothetical protein
MNIDEFWSIIEKSRKGWDRNHADGNQDRQVQALNELLSPLPSEEVASFERHFQDLFYGTSWGRAAPTTLSWIFATG